jgi:hypothetical protein
LLFYIEQRLQSGVFGLQSPVQPGRFSGNLRNAAQRGSHLVDQTSQAFTHPGSILVWNQRNGADHLVQRVVQEQERLEL